MDESTSMPSRTSCICFSVAAFIGPSSAWSPLGTSKHVMFGTLPPQPSRQQEWWARGERFQRMHVHAGRVRTANPGIMGRRNMPTRIWHIETQLSSTAPVSAPSTTAMEEKSGMQLRTLYPTSNATNNGTLDVGSMHILYYEQYNDPSDASLNALFLHGGPGAGCFPNHARFFSPDHYRVTLLDQRGCGRSAPKGDTTNNTLTHLVEDIELLRIHLGYDKWDVILGGSWGTTLALAYAQTHPERVGGMVLRGVCLFRQAEIDWLFARNGGADKQNPKGWKDFEKAVGVDVDEMNLPVNGSGSGPNRDALNRYFDCLLGKDPVLRVNAMSGWMKWEMSMFSLSKKGKNNTAVNTSTCSPGRPLLVWDKLCGWSFHDAFGPIDAGETDASAAEEAELLRRFSADEAFGHSIRFDTSAPPTQRVIDENAKQHVDKKLHELPPNVTEDQAKSFVPAQAMLTCYYSTNIAYVMGQYCNLLTSEAIERLRSAGIRCIAVQGGQDFVCPPDSALDLVQAWPEVELRISLEAGHSMYDAEICSELVKATDRFAGVHV